VVGGSGYAINLVVFTILTDRAAVHHIPAAVLAFVVAVTNNFLWNRHWTFVDAKDGHAGFQAVRFFAVSVAALLVNLVALELLVRAGMPVVGAQALAIGIATPFNYVGNKLWTFD